MTLKFNYTVAPHLEEFNAPFPTFRAARPKYTHFVGGGLIFSRTATSSKENNESNEVKQGEAALRVLLLQRAFHDAYGGRWEGPGGSCEEDDETLLYGVAREVFEECGLRVSRFLELVGTDEWVKLRPDRVITVAKYTFLVEVEEAKPAIASNDLDKEKEDGLPADKTADGGLERGLSRRWEDMVKLDPEEHQDFDWVTEEEIRAGAGDKSGNFKSFGDQEKTILEGFRILKERVAVE
ncbi:NUDIX hydrolase [Aspergillus lucknowensis]|uniref:NUDIX hydrolase domain-like protein n=1 Tax=Aspergillus lucknowensis TaxID=176173 RepID=A0ABR4LXA5_9EURO